MEQNRDGFEVVNNPEEQRFEARVDGRLAFTQYQRAEGVIAYVHTEVPEDLRGEGIADALARTALEYAREQDLGVVPLCPFVAAYIRRHQEYQPLVVNY